MAGKPFDIAWREIEARAAPFGKGYMDGGVEYVAWGDGAVASYVTFDSEGPQAGPMVWRSSDLVEWHRVIEPIETETSIDVRRLFVGGPGLVASGGENNVGSILWVSADGEHWDMIRELPAVDYVWARPGIIVAFGDKTWISADGRDWTPTGPSPLSARRDPWVPSARVLGDDGDSAIVSVRFSNYQEELVEEPSEIWRLTPDGQWDRLSEIDGEPYRAVRGPNQVVAVGFPNAWLSIDGTSWQSGAGPSGAENLIATPAGYVATQQRSYYQGCDGYAPAEQVAQTWTSHDGLTWRMMPEQTILDHTHLMMVFLDGDRLLASGLRFSTESSDEFEPVAFAADLPKPEPSQQPLPTGGGCGGPGA